MSKIKELGGEITLSEDLDQIETLIDKVQDKGYILCYLKTGFLTIKGFYNLQIPLDGINNYIVLEDEELTYKSEKELVSPSASFLYLFSIHTVKLFSPSTKTFFNKTIVSCADKFKEESLIINWKNKNIQQKVSLVNIRSLINDIKKSTKENKQTNK
jgi:hypothetical protein